MTQYLSSETILVLHSEIIDKTGGLHGVRDVALLAAIMDKPKATFGGNDLYQNIFVKAAVYLESIVNYHVFIDGNKRTGVIACARFLYQNGYTFSATNEEVERFVLSIAAEKIEIQIIVTWLEKHSKKARKPLGERKKR